MLETIAARWEERLYYINADGLGNLMWAFAKLDVRPRAKMVAAVAKRAEEVLPAMGALEASNVAWAFAVWEHLPPDGLLGRLGWQAVKSPYKLSTQRTADLLWAYAKLGKNVDCLSGHHLTKPWGHVVEDQAIGVDAERLHSPAPAPRLLPWGIPRSWVYSLN